MKSSTIKKIFTVLGWVFMIVLPFVFMGIANDSTYKDWAGFVGFCSEALLVFL